MRGNLEGLNDEGEVAENYKVVKRLIGHQSGKAKNLNQFIIFTFYFLQILLVLNGALMGRFWLVVVWTEQFVYGMPIRQVPKL